MDYLQILVLFCVLFQAEGKLSLTLAFTNCCLFINNTKDNVPLIIEPKTDRVLLLDESSRSFIEISQRTSKGLYIRATAPKSTRDINLYNLDQEVLRVTSRLGMKLIDHIEDVIVVDETLPLKLVLSISARISLGFREKLEGLGNNIHTDVKLNDDLAALDNTLQALIQVVEASGKKTWAELNIPGKPVLEAYEGLRKFTFIVKHFMANNITLKNLADIINHPIKGSYFISQLGGGLKGKTAGACMLVAKFYELALNFTSSPIPLLDGLINYLSREKDRKDNMVPYNNQGQTQLITVLRKNEELFAPVIECVETFQAGNLTAGGANVSLIFDLVLGPINGEPLNILLKIVQALNGLVSTETSMANIVLILLSKLDSPITDKQVKALVPELDLDSITPKNPKHKLNAILKNIDPFLVKEDLYEALSSSDTTKVILRRLIPQRTILNTNSEATQQILGLIQISTGLKLVSSEVAQRLITLLIK